MVDSLSQTVNEDDMEICPIHGCALKDFVSSTEDGTEYFIYCPKCEEEYKEWLLNDSTPTKKCTEDCPEIEKGCTAYHKDKPCLFDGLHRKVKEE